VRETLDYETPRKPRPTVIASVAGLVASLFGLILSGLLLWFVAASGRWVGLFGVIVLEVFAVFCACKYIHRLRKRE
jgi:hypothetical protein